MDVGLTADLWYFSLASHGKFLRDLQRVTKKYKAFVSRLEYGIQRPTLPQKKVLGVQN